MTAIEFRDCTGATEPGVDAAVNATAAADEDLAAMRFRPQTMRPAITTVATRIPSDFALIVRRLRERPAMEAGVAGGTPLLTKCRSPAMKDCHVGSFGSPAQCERSAV